MPELVFFCRGEEVRRVALERQRLVLGRGEDSDVVIPDPHVSRQQVALLLDGTRCLLEDLSGQGTLVAGKPMRHGELPDGADLKLGQWSAVFRQRGSAGTAGPTRRDLLTDVQSREAQEDGLPPAQVRVKQGTTEFLHPIGADSFTVGKDPANALVVQDRFISSQHLHVTRREAGFHVRDLNSTNGTFLGGVCLFEVEIPLNTVLRVGETELIFEPATQGQQEPSFHGLVGNDPAMRQLVELIKRVAPFNAVVTVLGESGTGKELVAWALHEASPRAGAALRPHQLRSARPGSDRERAARPREGGPHRRGRQAPGRLRGGPGGHALPGRGGRAAAGAAGPAAARVGQRGSQARGSQPSLPRGHEGGGGDAPGPAGLGPGRGSSSRTCTTGWGPCRWCCRRCAAGARTSGGWPSTSYGCTRRRGRR